MQDTQDLASFLVPTTVPMATLCLAQIPRAAGGPAVLPFFSVQFYTFFIFLKKFIRLACGLGVNMAGFHMADSMVQVLDPAA